MFSIVIRILPKKLMSWIVGRLTLIHWPEFLLTPMKSWFVSQYKLNMDEAEKPLSAYKCLNELFTRKLKKGVRPIGEGVVHPADSEITQFGELKKTGGGSYMVQAKGFHYTLEALLNHKDVDDFDGGFYITYYLCPTDYHRVHSPVEGKIIGYNYNPGFLWPVNEWSTHNIKNLFAINERVVIWIETEKGRVAVTLVGATNVGKIQLSFLPDFVTNRFFSTGPSHVKLDQPVEVSRGDELGIFHLGSTVIMAYSKDYGDLKPELGFVKYGESF